MHEPESQGLVSRHHLWKVQYRVVMDSAGPFSYRVFAPTSVRDGDWIERRITTLLGEANIKSLRAAPLGEHSLMVELSLVAAEIECRGEVYSQSSMSIEDDVREFLPEDHIISVTVLKGTPIRSHGPRR